MNLNLLTLLTLLGGVFCIIIQTHYQDKEKPAGLDLLYTVEILAIAIIVIQWLGIELALTATTLVFAPYFYWAKRRLNQGRLTEDSLHYQLATTFPILLLLWGIRSFVVQPYRVPSGSLEPTVRIGDFILVNQFKYGLQFPVSHHILWSGHPPQRGDIALFRWPKNPDIIFVKRVIGLPGDHIQYRNQTLFINGAAVKRTHCHAAQFKDPNATLVTPVKTCLEKLPNGPQHHVYYNRSDTAIASGDWVVPEHHYFMMGDNRDNSNDSRFWGSVPRQALIGQALWVWLSFDGIAWKQHDFKHLIRWHRIGTRIQ